MNITITLTEEEAVDVVKGLYTSAGEGETSYELARTVAAKITTARTAAQAEAHEQAVAVEGGPYAQLG